MTKYEIPKPIGLKVLCKEIDQTCSQADLYRKCGLRPSHLIVSMNPGSGRTTFLEYMTERYKEAGILGFNSGLDEFIELTFDGSLPQLERVFAIIDSAAIYTNEYSDLIGMDISEIASHPNETQYVKFLKKCKTICDHALVVFFVRSVPSGNEERLLKALCESIDNIKQLRVAPYTNDEICDLIIKSLGEHNAEIKNTEAFRAVLINIVSEFHITNVQKAIQTAKRIIEYAAFSGGNYVVDENSLKFLISEWHQESERSDVR